MAILTIHENIIGLKRTVPDIKGLIPEALNAVTLNNLGFWVDFGAHKQKRHPLGWRSDVAKRFGTGPACADSLLMRRWRTGPDDSARAAAMGRR